MAISKPGRTSDFRVDSSIAPHDCVFTEKIYHKLSIQKQLCGNCNLYLHSCLDVDDNLLYYFRWRIQTRSRISNSASTLIPPPSPLHFFSNIPDYFSGPSRWIKAKLTQSTVYVSSSHMYPTSYYLHRKVSSSS